MIGFAALVVTLALGAADWDVRLAGPEVSLLDWNTRNLVAHDFDGDGRTDLALLNNDRARIELLYQREPGKKDGARRAARERYWKPELEDGRFERRNVVTGISMFAMAAGDLNGDGRADLAVTGKPDGVTVFLQQRDGSFERGQVFEVEQPTQWIGSIEVADLDEDGRDELIVLGQEELMIFDPARSGELATPRRYRLADEGCYSLNVRDVDGDGRLDLSYLATKSDYAWRGRMQRKDGGFGPERNLPMKTPRGALRPLDLGGRVQQFAGIEGRSGNIRLLQLSRSSARKSKQGGDMFSPRVYSTPTGDNEAGNYALGDFDGDGRVDLAVGERKGAQLWLYLQREDGTFAEPTAFPSFSGVRSLTAGDADGDGRDELFVVSADEASLGVSALSGEGRLSYPRPLPVEGKPLAATAFDSDGDGRIELAYVFEDGGVRSTAILSRSGDAEAGWQESKRVELDEVRTDPMALESIDANQDGLADLAVFIVRSPMRLLLQVAGGEFEDATAAEGFRQGLIDNLLPSTLSSGDLDGDGKSELIVSGRGFARALSFGSGGDLEVRDQFNAPDQQAEIAAAVTVDVEQDGTPEILLTEEDGEKLEVLKRDELGVYRHTASVPVGRIGLVDTRVLDLDGDGNKDVLFLGEDRFWTVPVGGADLRVDEVERYETDLEGMDYTLLTPGDLNGDGIDELVALDTRNSRVMEILQRGEAGDGDGWVSRLHFPIFELDVMFEGRRGAAQEPREALIADVTGNGKQDIVLLIHDRVLVYTNE
ncbi:hypothetical protein ABI59_14240 [Acidobacteria bacterium Mor1]|nr:hypothetical protein ABI59_14240 [Acidobacteria bacterium Mor1]